MCISDTAVTHLATTALSEDFERRGPPRELMCHLDQSSQYSHAAYRHAVALLDNTKMSTATAAGGQSLNVADDCMSLSEMTDNSLAPSFKLFIASLTE